MPLLTAANLTFAYDEQPVLRGVGVALAAGEVVSVLGPNGSGKTTLIRALLGHLHVAGEIVWQDRPLARWSRRELAKLVAYLPQAPVFDGEQAVADALRLGRAPYWGAFGLESGRDLAVVAEVMKLLELEDLSRRRMNELSGGQRQRVFLGRCLAQEPKAMLLDEPNTYLDLKHQVDLCRLLVRLARDRGIAVLMASHDLNLAAAFSDRLVLLDGGRVVAAGPASKVLDPALLSRVYGTPLDRIDRPDGKTLVVPLLEK